MSCRRIQYLIQACVDGAASGAEREAVDAHLERCAECAQVMAESRRLVSVLASVPARETSGRFEQSLMAALQAAAPAACRSAWWERFSLRLDWRLRVPALVTAGSLAAGLIAVGAQQAIQIRDRQRERGRYVAAAVERHQELEQAGTDLAVVEASIELSTGDIVAE